MNRNALNRNAMNSNARDMGTDLEWLAETLRRRLADYFSTGDDAMPDDRQPSALMPPPPTLTGDSSYAAMLGEYQLSGIERLILMLALAPALRPQLLDVLLTRNEATQRGFTEFGETAGYSRPTSSAT